MQHIRQDLEQARQLLDVFLADDNNIVQIAKAGELMTHVLSAGGKIISCGNGGSMCDAMHLAEELTGRFRDDRKPLPAIAISDPSYISCVANDYGFEHVFSRFVEGLGNTGDVLCCISTSGNSENIIKAAQAAKAKGIKVIGLTGKDGGKLAELSDVEIRAPFSKYSDRTQEIHIKVIHCLIGYIEWHI